MDVVCAPFNEDGNLILISMILFPHTIDRAPMDVLERFSPFDILRGTILSENSFYLWIYREHLFNKDREGSSQKITVTDIRRKKSYIYT